MPRASATIIEAGPPAPFRGRVKDVTKEIEARASIRIKLYGMYIYICMVRTYVAPPPAPPGPALRANVTGSMTSSNNSLDGSVCCLLLLWFRLLAPLTLSIHV